VELPVLVAIILVVIVAIALLYTRARGTRLRMMMRYMKARALTLKAQPTATEEGEVEAIRAACVREWGPLMDPTQPARQRLQYLPPELQMTTAGLDGSEDPADEEVFADCLLNFIGPGWAAVNPSDWETIWLDFARHIYDRHSLAFADRGEDERDTLTVGAVRAIALHFFDFPLTQVRYKLPRGGRQDSSNADEDATRNRLALVARRGILAGMANAPGMTEGARAGATAYVETFDKAFESATAAGQTPNEAAVSAGAAAERVSKRVAASRGG
jgi:hypothetical protein